MVYRAAAAAAIAAPIAPVLAPTAPVLALNSGSSSLKFGLYQMQQGRTTCLLDGQAHSSGSAAGTLQAWDGQGRPLPCPDSAQGQAAATPQALVQRIAGLITQLALPAPHAIGHRVVHGGPQVRQHARITPALLQQLAAATPFAPLHTPAVLGVVQAALQQYPALPQVVCLDTCFHASLPDVARVLALPRALRQQGIQRYGFHGLSCESIVQQLGSKLPRRLLIAHLGNGASVSAVLGGVSVDTSMGLTPSGGLVMGSRSGDLDPGALAYLVRTLALDAGALQDLIDRQSGLLGVSGLSSDMRCLHAAAAGPAPDPDARLAVALFCYSAAKTLAAQCVALGGVDLIVFTGGIGEHDALVRAAIGTHLAWLGVDIDATRNAGSGQADAGPANAALADAALADAALADAALAGAGRVDPGLISSDASRCQVRVLPSQEDAQIARHTWALCGAAEATAAPHDHSTDTPSRPTP